MTTNSSGPYPKRWEIYDVALDAVVGSQIGKRRPALVVSNDINNRFSTTVTVVPLTSAAPRRDFPFEAMIPAGVSGLPRDSRAKCDQIRTVDKRRVRRLRGVLPPDLRQRVERAIKVHLHLS